MCLLSTHIQFILLTVLKAMLIMTLLILTIVLVYQLCEAPCRTGVSLVAKTQSTSRLIQGLFAGSCPSRRGSIAWHLPDSPIRGVVIWPQHLGPAGPL